MVMRLSLPGISSYIQAPSMAFDAVEIDAVLNIVAGTDQYLIDARLGASSGYIFRQGSTGNDNIGGNWSGTLQLDGVTKNSGTVIFQPGVRYHLIRLDVISSIAPVTDDLTFFSRYTFANFMAADVYDIKIYNAGLLVAHYDFTTGTAVDQSGNGKDATVTGGTFADDGTGADTTPPAVPTGLAATAGIKQVTLDANPNTEPDFQGYNVYVGGVKNNANPIPTLPITVSGLADSTLYSFTLSAVDTSGNESAQTAAVSATTLAAPPPPTGVFYTKTVVGNMLSI